ncbi:MAG: N-acetylmuramoyl-L-alanine amidase family protein [Gemmatimonadales bacterium]
MIAVALALLGATAPPGRLQVNRSDGVVTIPLVERRGEGPLLSLNALARAVRGHVQRDDPWVTLQTDAGDFRFLAGTPVVQVDSTLRALPGISRPTGDSVLVPLAFVAELLADPARGAWKWVAATAVLSERPVASPLAIHASRTTVGSERRNRLPNGLRAGHRVTIDPGHGGVDPGNPGLFFPHGLTEKDVTLAVSLLVRDDLQKQGVRVTMTRTRDTLINLGDRAPRYCGTDCDLFVSVHVNSLARRPGYTEVRGFETYFLSEARSADAARVARMENAAVRFDNPEKDAGRGDGLDFMFKDLQTGESLRESQQAASLIQSFMGEVHDGPDHGVKQANFAVLTTARRPAILIEMGYATNRADAALMTSRNGQRKLASTIASAIVEYLRRYDNETADTSSGGGQ